MLPDNPRFLISKDFCLSPISFKATGGSKTVKREI